MLCTSKFSKNNNLNSLLHFTYKVSNIHSENLRVNAVTPPMDLVISSYCEFFLLLTATPNIKI